ncbi:hypothetical protein [Haloferula sargassicola]|uniref:Uncharacterized protein n=1 Tax=Haloferula sargassicola TaxID=490096 RepID=A0ABP9UR95_9BACT
MKKILLLSLLGIGSAFAQESDDPFADPSKVRPPDDPVHRADDTRRVSCCFEVFRLSQQDALELTVQQLDDEAFYHSLVEQSDAGDASREILHIIRGRSNEKVTGEAVTEFIYPTEYEPVGPQATKAPAESGDELEGEATDQDPPHHPAIQGIDSMYVVPCSFETRNIGTSAEMIVGLDESDELVELKLSLDRVLYLGNQVWGEGPAKVEMPIFSNQGIQTTLNGRIGKVMFVGSFNPPVNAKDPDSSDQVWLVFVTPTLSRP